MSSYRITRSLDQATAKSLEGFFEGWGKHPDTKTFLKILETCPFKTIAFLPDSYQVIGFVYAISDGILSAYIPLLEVLPTFRKMGIGRSLVEDLLNQLQGHYMIDVCCDAEVIPFYEKLGFTRIAAGMVRRDYSAQEGRS